MGRVIFDPFNRSTSKDGCVLTSWVFGDGAIPASRAVILLYIAAEFSSKRPEAVILSPAARKHDQLMLFNSIRSAESEATAVKVVDITGRLAR